MNIQNTACLILLLFAGNSLAEFQTAAGTKPGLSDASVQSALSSASNLASGIVNEVAGPSGTVSPPSPTQPPLAPGTPAGISPPTQQQPPSAPGSLQPPPTSQTPAPGPAEDPYLFGVYQPSGPFLGASVYTGNRTVQYTGQRDANDVPTNLTQLSVIVSTIRTNIAVGANGVAATISSDNATLTVGLPVNIGDNIVVSYTLYNYNTGNNSFYNISVPAANFPQTSTRNAAAAGRRLLQLKPCEQISRAAARFCETFSQFSPSDEIDNALKSGLLLESYNFIETQYAAMQQGTVILVGASAGITAAGAAEIIFEIGTVGLSTYAVLGTSCTLYKGANTLYASIYPCKPQKGNCDDNGNDDGC